MPRIYWLSKAFMRHPNVEIMLSSMMGKLTGYCKCQGEKCGLKLMLHGAELGLLRWAERVCWTKWSGAERGDCKRRGRGLGQRNMELDNYF